MKDISKGDLVTFFDDNNQERAGVVTKVGYKWIHLRLVLGRKAKLSPDQIARKVGWVGQGKR